MVPVDKVISANQRTHGNKGGKGTSLGKVIYSECDLGLNNLGLFLYRQIYSSHFIADS